jgi:hypothetical protein
MVVVLPLSSLEFLQYPTQPTLKIITWYKRREEERE